ncbi:MAG: 50S ribosomal protein L24 [Clostridia bacterium]|nr:50S ribosomal protein L24 [Clostridia bacterium]
MEIKKGDTVVVISGEEKGKKATVIKAYPSKRKVVLEGVNMVTKHMKPRGANQPGGKVEQPAPIDVSNVMLVCPECGKATKVAHDKVEGKNVRKCKKCGAVIDTKAAPKKATAKKAKKSVKKSEEPAAETVTEETETAPKAKKATKKATKKTAPATDATETEVK